jgi:Flp pilus assembly protein TadB
MGFPIVGVKVVNWLRTLAGRAGMALVGIAGLILAGMRMQAQRHQKKRMKKKAATLGKLLELESRRREESEEDSLDRFKDHFTE